MLNWLKEGDANTAYFHHHARYWKRKNFIAKFNVDDQIATEQEEKRRRPAISTITCWVQ
jgi:hypothetical protein